MSVVIIHAEFGIYLGNCLGLGFWTLLDPVGQPCAVTFPTTYDAVLHIKSWDENNSPSAYQFACVKESSLGCADILALKTAGLSHLLGDMEADALRYGDSAGTA